MPTPQFTSSVAPIANSPMTNVIAPDLMSKQVQLQRQQQIAQMLQQQGLSPTEQQVIGGWAVKQNPLLHLAKLAQVLGGTYMQRKSDAEQGDINTQMGQRLAQQLQGTYGVGGGGSVGSNSPASSAASGGNSIVPASATMQENSVSPEPAAVDPRRAAAYAAALTGNNQLASSLMENVLNQTDQQKQDAASGITPAQRNAITSGVDMKPNQSRVQIGPDGKPSISIVAPDPEGGMQYNVTGGKVSAQPVDNAGLIAGSMEASRKLGANTQTLAPTDQLLVNPDGTLQPKSVAETLGFPTGTMVPSTTPVIPMKQGQDDRLTILQTERANPKNTPEDNAALDREIARLPSSVKPLGVGKPTALDPMIKDNANVASGAYSKLTEINMNAPTILDSLRDIKKYSKGAIIGAEADSREFINGLKTIIPGFDSANDAKTNTDLFNKSANRLVASSSNVSGATDALRTIAAAMNPNNHMSVDAVNEAVDKLSSIIKMQQGNLKAISPHQISGDYKKVLETHNTFNTNADPRIYQLQDMQPTDQAKFINTLSPEDAKKLLKQRSIIKGLGGLQ